MTLTSDNTSAKYKQMASTPVTMLMTWVMHGPKILASWLAALAPMPPRFLEGPSSAMMPSSTSPPSLFAASFAFSLPLTRRCSSFRRSKSLSSSSPKPFDVGAEPLLSTRVLIWSSSTLSVTRSSSLVSSARESTASLFASTCKIAGPSAVSISSTFSGSFWYPFLPSAWRAAVRLASNQSLMSFMNNTMRPITKATE